MLSEIGKWALDGLKRAEQQGSLGSHRRPLLEYMRHADRCDTCSEQVNDVRCVDGEMLFEQAEKMWKANGGANRLQHFVRGAPPVVRPVTLQDGRAGLAIGSDIYQLREDRG